MKRAFELRGEFKDSTGGSVATADGSLINVGERLENGGGVIVVDKADEADALAGAFFLKEVPVPAKGKGGKGGGS